MIACQKIYLKSRIPKFVKLATKLSFENSLNHFNSN